MQKRLFNSIVVALLLSGCSTEPIDPTRNWSADKLYAEAREEMAEGRHEQAIRYFEKLEARYPFGIYAQQAQMEIAYAHYRMGERELALAAVDRFLRLHPSHAKVDYMLYLRGLIYANDRSDGLDALLPQDRSQRDLLALQQAFDAFKQLAARFPNSVYADDARRRMEQLLNSMAQHEVNVASYYFRRGAYLAAANRAQETVKNYQGSPVVEQALAIMVRSYDMLGLAQLRDDAERVLRLNFPDSKLLPAGHG